MNPGVSGVEVGQVRVLITNGGNHTPETWARETADSLIVIDDGLEGVKRQEAVTLRQKIARTLLDSFAAVKAKSLASEIEQISAGAIRSVFDAAKGSPWEVYFYEPNTRSAMALTIRRNIMTAADLALRTE